MTEVDDVRQFGSGCGSLRLLILLLSWSLVVLSFASAVDAYTEEDHYLWTYYLAVHAGYSERQAFQLASAAASFDAHALDLSVDRSATDWDVAMAQKNPGPALRVVQDRWARLAGGTRSASPEELTDYFAHDRTAADQAMEASLEILERALPKLTARAGRAVDRARLREVMARLVDANPLPAGAPTRAQVDAGARAASGVTSPSPLASLRVIRRALREDRAEGRLPSFPDSAFGGVTFPFTRFDVAADGSSTDPNFALERVQLRTLAATVSVEGETGVGDNLRIVVVQPYEIDGLLSLPHLEVLPVIEASGLEGQASTTALRERGSGRQELRQTLEVSSGALATATWTASITAYDLERIEVTVPLDQAPATAVTEDPTEEEDLAEVALPQLFEELQTIVNRSGERYNEVIAGCRSVEESASAMFGSISVLQAAAVSADKLLDAQSEWPREAQSLDRDASRLGPRCAAGENEEGVQRQAVDLIRAARDLSGRAVKLAPTVSSQIANPLSSAEVDGRIRDQQSALGESYRLLAGFREVREELSRAKRRAAKLFEQILGRLATGQTLGNMTPTVLQDLYDRLLYNTDTAQGCADSAFVTLENLRGRLESAQADRARASEGAALDAARLEEIAATLDELSSFNQRLEPLVASCLE